MLHLHRPYVVTWYQKYPGYALNQVGKGLPKATTETGWDSVSDPGGEDVQGKVLTNVYLDQFHRGYRWTYIYELGNGEGGGGNQGLFENDWTPKLSATYIHNLTTILADPGPPQTPGSLAVGIPKQPAPVHHMLMQKSSGVFELAVWGEQVSGSNNVNVRFGGATVSSVNVYDVTLGTTPVVTYADVRSVPLTMSDHAMIVEITP